MNRPLPPPPLGARRPCPCLTFTPLAWLKLQYFCHAGPTEVGGFGVAAERDLLYVEDFVTVRQETTPASVRFEDEAVADYFDGCLDRGLVLDRCARLWCHTHPGGWVRPSQTDEETFARCFGRCDWAVMFILARAGTTYARLTFRAGPGAQVELPTAVDWAAWPTNLQGGQQLADQVERWREEYAAHVRRMPEPADPFAVMLREGGLPPQDWWESHPWSEELDGVFYEPLEKDGKHAPESHRLAP
jgi:hypothetical protein